jgi:hypothetical protein
LDYYGTKKPAGYKKMIEEKAILATKDELEKEDKA